MLIIANKSIVATALQQLVSVTRNASEPGRGEVPDCEEFYDLLSCEWEGGWETFIKELLLTSLLITAPLLTVVAWARVLVEGHQPLGTGVNPWGQEWTWQANSFFITSVFLFFCFFGLSPFFQACSDLLPCSHPDGLLLCVHCVSGW